MKILLLALLVVLTGCSPDSPSSGTSVAFLVAHPKRLQELREQCHENRNQVGDAVCARVAKATNRRFFGKGKTPYTPPKSSPKF
ncbi:EexN family lipoprotein [Salinisphaera hydrothermalis]|uniref:EexN family lipoprotein n=1 Tax=Salinisphaera hydrothermalis TaxID=563188 RepID=UPI00333E24B2